MKIPKWPVVLCSILMTISWSATFAESKNVKPQGIIFSAEQIRSQKYVRFPQPYWTPSQEQIDRLEKKLPAYVKEQSKHHSRHPTIKLSKYKRQYFGYSLNGKKVIYVNAFCHSFDDWEKYFVLMKDGGECFFQATFDPESDKFISFCVNGEA